MKTAIKPMEPTLARAIGETVWGRVSAIQEGLETFRQEALRIAGDDKASTKQAMAALLETIREMEYQLEVLKSDRKHYNECAKREVTTKPA